MTRYQNGQIPLSALKKIGEGTDANGPYEWWGSVHILALWAATQAYCHKKWNITPHIRTGWNIYRPLDVQAAARKRACAAGNCLGAASPGYSSHGGTWINKAFTGGVWVDALAIDVNPNGLTWAQVWEAGRANGFLCGAITAALAGIDEPWHIIDLDPWAPAPATSGPSIPFPAPTPTPTPREDSTMSKLYYYTADDTRTGTAAGWALAGDGQGQAAWLDISDSKLASDLAADTISGHAIWLAKSTFDAWKAKYIAGAPGASLNIDPTKLTAAIVAGIKGAVTG